MGIYEAAKDALKVAQSVDNLELVQKLLDVQKMALDMQEKQQEQTKCISKLEQEIDRLKESKKFVFADGEPYLIDPDSPDRHLCPVHTVKHGFAFPLVNDYCHECKRVYES